jgi:ubiquinone biosynthesis protein
VRSRTPQQFRALLERLGPTFVKFGQFLALRPDVLPQEYCDELLQLTDRVDPFGWPTAQAIIEAELGEPIDVLFASVSRKPVAAGSLAQVHVGRLHDGTEIALKVQRPGLDRAIERDLRRIATFARLLEMSGAELGVSPREVVDELGEWLRQEIDFERELSNMRRLERLTASSSSQRVPRAYPEYCTPKLLAAEYLRGVPVSTLLRHDDVGGVDKVAFGERLVTAMLTQIFRYRFFHADVHPGNLLVLPGDVVGFVDFGLCDRLDEQIRRRQLRYLAAVYSGDQGRIFQAVSEILIPSEDTDMEAFRRDFNAETQRVEFSSAPDGAGGKETSKTERSPFATYLVGMMRAARRNRLRVPARVLAMYRAMLTTETIANRLGLRDGVREIGREFFAGIRRDEIVAQYSDPENLESALLAVLNLKREAPGQLNQLLSELTDGTFSLATRSSDAPAVTRAKNRRTRLMTSAIVSVGVSVLLTVPNLPVLFGVPLAWPLTAVLVAVYAWTFVQWSRL